VSTERKHPDLPERKPLETFLGGARWRRLVGAELRRELREAFATRPEYAPEELEPYRIMVAWRLARRTLALKGLISDEERLEDALVEADSWSARTRPLTRPIAGQRGPRPQALPVLLLHAEERGLPVLPFGLDAPERVRWCDAAVHVARIIGVEATEAGCHGLLGLLDPVSVEVNHPSAKQLLAFEEMLLLEATELLVTAGDRATLAHYREGYGFVRDECLGILRMARARAREECSADVEENRALLAAYWKDYIDRARKEPVGMVHEARGYKELAKVLGVTRTEPENMLGDFIKTVAAVAGEARAKALAASPTQKTLPPSEKGELIADYKVIGTGREVDSSEAEALEAFDKERLS